jgi:hypothetical protein
VRNEEEGVSTNIADKFENRRNEYRETISQRDD